MDLQQLDESIKQEFFAKTFQFGSSFLTLNHLPAVDHDLRRYKRKGIVITTEELAEYLAEKVIVDWQGIKTIDGLAIPFSKKAAFNAMNIDLNFMKLVVETSSLRSNFKVE